jgi:hypothetical protein
VLVVVILVLIAILLFRSNNGGVESAPPATQLIQQPGSSSAGQAALPANTIIFCLQFDGRQDGHLPALMGGSPDAVLNMDKTGSNWALTPTATGDEDYGILPNGTFFAKEEFLKKWAIFSSVAIKCDRTNWQPKEMTLSTIGGKPARIYN